MFAALGCLKPFLKPFDQAAFGSNLSRTGLFRYTNELNKNSTYYELSANDATNRSVGGGGGSSNRKNMGMQFQRSVADGEDDEIPLTDGIAAANLGPGHVGHTAEIRHSSQGDSGHGVRNIAKTQTWTVCIG